MFDRTTAKIERFITANEWRLLHVKLRAKLRYQSLQGLHKEPIRLLLLYPKSAGNAIHGKFVGAGLTDPPPYEALSYTWGNPFANPLAAAEWAHPRWKSVRQYKAWFETERRHEIYVNGRTIEIGQNLYDALYHIRDEKRKILIWVDALCINQADDDEKRHQVSIMDLIYRNATRVHVWLGPEGSLSGPEFHDSSLSHSDLSEDPSSLSRAHLFCRIFTSSWFQRLWVVQEVAVASGILFRCGNIQIEHWELENFVKSEHKVDRGSLGYNNDADDEVIDRAIKTFQRIMAVREIVGRIRLDLAVYAWRYNICRDQRDRVYALLSLARVSGARLLLEPDYGFPMSELSKTLVQASIQTYETLDVLRYVNHIDQIPISPSWAFVLDIATEKEGSVVKGGPWQYSNANIISSSEPALRHPKRALPSFFEYQGRSVLTLNGRIVLRIDAVGDHLYTNDDYTLAQTCDRENSYRFQMRAPMHPDDAAKFKSILLSTLAASRPDSTSLSSGANQEVSSIQTTFSSSSSPSSPPSSSYTYFYNEALPTDSTPPTSALLEAYEKLVLKWFWAIPEYGRFPDLAAAVFERSINARYPGGMYAHRRLALTHRRLHAIVPSLTRSGDVIVMASHSRCAFVLRPLLDYDGDGDGEGDGKGDGDGDGNEDDNDEDNDNNDVGGLGGHASDTLESEGKERGEGNGSLRKERPLTAVLNLGGDEGSSGRREGAGDSSSSNSSSTSGRRAFAFVGACYLQSRLDWEAFEALDLEELQEFWLF